MKPSVKIFFKSLAVILLAVVAVLVGFSVSPVYDFTPTKPFEGPDIFNPYASLDTTIGWKRANFHTHTRVAGWRNECELWPADVLSDYGKFGYDIVAFSNHNELTVHPTESSLQINVYEHGFNILKYHKLVFGCNEVWYFDNLVPIFASQRQWQLDELGKSCDFIQLNHPYRTPFSTRHTMQCLTGYKIIELDSGIRTDQEYWDWALSSGHYSFGLANDDCHDSRASDRIAVLCSFLNTGTASYQDVRETLLSGCYYSMRVPDFGDGDWAVKYAANKQLPSMENISLIDSTISIRFSKPVRLVEAIGQGHSLLGEFTETDEVVYKFPSTEPYVRFTAHFDDGVVIYTNPFAHYDKRLFPTPYVNTEHRVNALLSVLFNVCLALIVGACVFGTVRILLPKKSK